MPMIQTRVNRPITPDAEKSMAKKLGKAIELLGKSEKWLMLEFVDNCRLYFKGEDDRPMAYVEVKLLGQASQEQYERMTEEICRVFQEELSISPDCVYIYYGETAHWGWNGGNF